MKKSLYLLVCALHFWTVVVSSAWAGQVVTDDHRKWAKAAIAQEKALGPSSSPNTLAILYFINNSGRPELDPIQKGLAYMLITDLSKVEGLQVLERVRLQALVEELGLGASGLVDPQSAPRVGHLIGASRVLGGMFYPGEAGKFRIDPRLITVTSDQIQDLPDAAGLLEEIFRMEKELLFHILEILKITSLTPEKIAALKQPMTLSLPALVFLFKGFHESDQRNYQLAATYYEQALLADPGLTAAADALNELKALGLIGMNAKKPAGFIPASGETPKVGPDAIGQGAPGGGIVGGLGPAPITLIAAGTIAAITAVIIATSDDGSSTTAHHTSPHH